MVGIRNWSPSIYPGTSYYSGNPLVPIFKLQHPSIINQNELAYQFQALAWHRLSRIFRTETLSWPACLLSWAVDKQNSACTVRFLLPAWPTMSTSKADKRIDHLAHFSAASTTAKNHWRPCDLSGKRTVIFQNRALLTAQTKRQQNIQLDFCHMPVQPYWATEPLFFGIS